MDQSGTAHWRGRERLRLILRLLMTVIYVGFGILHVTRSTSFLPIMPPWVPFPRLVVIFTGVCEILGGLGLLGPLPLRRVSGVMLALYAIGVFPANLYHALAGVHVPGLPSSWWYHAPRLAFQPVFVWWALFAGSVIDWPWRARPSTSSG